MAFSEEEEEEEEEKCTPVKNRRIAGKGLGR